MGFLRTAVLLWAAVGGKHHTRARVRATRREWSRRRASVEQESGGFLSRGRDSGGASAARSLKRAEERGHGPGRVGSALPRVDPTDMALTWR